MPARALLIEVRFIEGRYHGHHDWPPSPFRMFQALVAAAYGGRWTCEPPAEKDEAFKWLEQLEPPYVTGPRAGRGAGVSLFVPNNDLDAKDGDPLRVGDIRVKKRIIPRLFDVEAPILYAWPFDEGERHAMTIMGLAERMHTLGLGFDAAFARAEVVSWDQAQAKLSSLGGPVARPHGVGQNTPTCPTAGSLDSLKARYLDTAKRFFSEGKAVLYSNARKPRFRQVAYDSPLARLLFDLLGDRTPWRLDSIVELTERVRDAAAQRLKEKLPSPEAVKVHNAIVSRRDADEVDKAARVRITPLPSIGHQHADRAIRRILVEIPPNCPVRVDDLEWAFSGLEVIDPAIEASTGELRSQLLLVSAGERGMLMHYGIEDAPPTGEQRATTRGRLWRTVTPAALPQQAVRRRIDPAQKRAEAKGGADRAAEESKAASAVIQALRHAGVSARPLAVRAQREPFEAKGARAEAFAHEPRFAKEQLWHVEVTFDGAEAPRGPLILGDGRYLGLGLMQPVKDAWRDVVSFSLAPNSHLALANRADLTHAVRRALMALSRDHRGDVPPLFSGHEPDGARARSGRHRHVFIAGTDLDRDDRLDQLIVAAPWACDRSMRSRPSERAMFDRVVGLLEVVRAGKLGVIPLQVSSTDRRLTGPARSWESHTDYHPCRHSGRGKDPAAPLLRDLATECERRGLPKPEIDLLDLSVGPNEGVSARVRLRFAVAVSGPILLGRDSHAGGGLFEAIMR